jgi:hypothetical protein
MVEFVRSINLLTGSITSLCGRAMTWVLLATLASCVPSNDLRDRGAPGSQNHDYDTQGAVGLSSQPLLKGEVFKTLTVEVQVLGKAEPTQEALFSLQRFLEKNLHKPGGVIIQSNSPLDGTSRESIRVSELKDLEKRYRQTSPFKTHYSLFLLFIDAASAEDTLTHQRFAHAYAQSSVVVYSPSIARYSGSTEQVPRWVLEASVLQHEVGHLLGLVNLGTPPLSAHEDTQAHGHCKQGSCLMRGNPLEAIRAHSAESGQVSPPDLCANCIEDLQSLSSLPNGNLQSALPKQSLRPNHTVHVPSKHQPEQRQKCQEPSRAKEDPLRRLISSPIMDSNLRQNGC